MEIGVFSRTYEVSDLKETYRRMTGHGICHTQFNFSNVGLASLPERVSERKILEIQELTAQCGVVIDALTGTFNMIDPDVEARKKGCAQFRLQCQLAQQLHIPIVSLCTGSKNPESKWKWHDDNERPQAWADLMRTTEEIIRYAEDCHVVLGVETEVSNIINTPRKARTYLDQVGSDNLKIIMDGANLFRPEQVPHMKETLDEAFSLLGKDIVIAHAKDFSCDGNVSFVAAGKGVLDFPYYVGLLKQYGYDGTLVMHGLSEQQVPASKAFLEGVISA